MSSAPELQVTFHCAGTVKPSRRGHLDGIARALTPEAITSARRPAARDCACTAGTVCRHNNACPRLPGRDLRRSQEG